MDGKRYFKCPAGTGVFIREKQLDQEINPKVVKKKLEKSKGGSSWKPATFAKQKKRKLLVPKVGAYYLCEGKMICICRFYGATRWSDDSKIVGVQVVEGEVQAEDATDGVGSDGKRYFKAPAGTGLFVTREFLVKELSGKEIPKQKTSRPVEWKPAAFRSAPEKKPVSRQPSGQLKGKNKKSGPRHQSKPKGWKQVKYKDPKKEKFLKDMGLDDIENVDAVLYEQFGILEDGVDVFQPG